MGQKGQIQPRAVRGQGRAILLGLAAWQPQPPLHGLPKPEQNFQRISTLSGHTIPADFFSALPPRIGAQGRQKGKQVRPRFPGRLTFHRFAIDVQQHIAHHQVTPRHDTQHLEQAILRLLRRQGMQSAVKGCWHASHHQDTFRTGQVHIHLQPAR